MLGATEMLIIGGVIGVFVFGPSFVAKIGKATGESIREFRKVKKELAEPLDLTDEK